jgi:hypothetical protein
MRLAATHCKILVVDAVARRAKISMHFAWSIDAVPRMNATTGKRTARNFIACLLVIVPERFDNDVTSLSQGAARRHECLSFYMGRLSASVTPPFQARAVLGASLANSQPLG